MRPGDLHRARAEIGIGIFIRDDRDQAAMLLRANRNLAKFSNNWRVTLIRRMNRNSSVAEHRLGPCGRDGDVVTFFFQHDIPVFVFLDICIRRAARERVFEVPHVTGHFEVFHLQVRDRCLEMRVPVH